MMESRKENYRLFVTIENDKIRQEKVRCKVYLPERLTDSVELHFFPTEDQVPYLRHAFEFSIQGEIQNLSGTVETRIQAHKVYSIILSSTDWGPGVTENLLIGEPADLQVIHFFSHDASNSPHKQTGNFWLTPSILLRPAQLISESWTGDVRVETVRQFNFTLANGLPLIFDNRFRYSKNQEGETITFNELIARYEAKEPNDIKNINNALSLLDDFLLLVSFAERQRCSCLGWETTDSKSTTEYYRRSLTIPAPKGDHGYEDTLIPLQNFEDFIGRTYQKFIEIEPKEHIRQAMQCTIYRKGRTIENSFLTLFTALETLLEHFGLRPYIIDPKQFKKTFLKNLREWLKKQPLVAGKKKEFGLMCEKLFELNRVSFRSAFNGLCNSYPVFLQDLWPIINKTKGISLYDIRNKLVHGETFFNPLQQRALLTAEKHLRWTVERFILSILGWHVSASNVSKQVLYSQVIPCYENWKTDQKILSG